MSMINRILVATDFSPAGRLAVTRAGQLASQYGAELRLVHATPDWDLFSRWTSARREHHQAVTQHAEHAMSHEAAWVSSQFGIRSRCDIQLGKASRVIARVVADYRPSLVVAGARGEHRAPDCG